MWGMRLPIHTSMNAAKMSTIKRQILMYQTPFPRRSSRIESTMEMRLSHFIDPTHQGGHPHRGFF